MVAKVNMKDMKAGRLEFLPGTCRHRENAGSGLQGNRLGNNLRREIAGTSNDGSLQGLCLYVVDSPEGKALRGVSVGSQSSSFDKKRTAQVLNLGIARVTFSSV